MVAPFNPTTFPDKFHMGCYAAPFGDRFVSVAFVIPCVPSDQFPGFFAVFKSKDKAQMWLDDWAVAFNDAKFDSSVFTGSVA